MGTNMANDLELQNLLSAVTDALLADDGDVDAIVGRYAVPRADVVGLIGIIRRLHMTLVGAQPSRRFVRRLKHELVGETDRNIVARVRYLPPRVQIAAGIALVAGFMLFTRRRMIDDMHHEGQEVPALQ
jgi:type VI protein secretion system component VasF